MKLPTIIHHPYEFLCPVSGQLMIYPVLCEDGDSCEKEFVGDKTHINNHTLRSVILGYRVRTAKYYLEELSDFFESNDIPDIELTPFFKQSIPLKSMSGISHNF